MIPVETKWLILNNKQPEPVTIQTKTRNEQKYVYIPQIETEIGDSVELNRLRPIASMCENLVAVAPYVKPMIEYQQAILGRVIITDKDKPELQYSGRVELLKEGDSYHIIYLVDSPDTLHPDIYKGYSTFVISDVLLQYI